MKLRDLFAPVGAVLALTLALIELFQSPESRITRLSPGILFLIAALMGARTALRRQSRKREELLKSVPRHPLGLDEEN
jgi:hypothetical protein